MGTIKTTNIETITGSGTLTIGQSGETISIPTNTTLGASGTTITVPSGCTITNNGTQTGFGETNTPFVKAYLNGTQVISATTVTKINFNAEVIDTDNCFDSTTNYRFTPTTAGYYFINLHVGGAAHNGDVNAFVQLNGSTNYYTVDESTNASYIEGGARIIYFNGSSDYAEFYTRFGSGRTISGNSTNLNTQVEIFRITQ